MIISTKHKYIFIANPKTGTTSIQSFLLENDPLAKNYHVVLNNKSYSFKEHDTAAKIKKTLGDEYNNYKTFGFVRNPMAKRVSGYHFLNNGKPITEGHKGPRWPILTKIWFAKLLPFKLWNLLYPVKTNKEYFTDEQGNVIVDRIYIFENIEEDFEKALKFIGMYEDNVKLPYKNRSKHKKYNKYFNNKIYNYIVKIINYKDIEFYNECVKNVK
ncbi:sulfotransferase family 2 domain-containing protein [Rhodohalobacter sp. 8-1]|uniref:sulfotransferase family 2 domain-containing protein n=1 Tax=Rhodohalobacter sp. 8-1 TaxID=3131972 RepID=UPI0030EBCDDA